MYIFTVSLLLAHPVLLCISLFIKICCMSFEILYCQSGILANSIPQQLVECIVKKLSLKHVICSWKTFVTGRVLVKMFYAYFYGHATLMTIKMMKQYSCNVVAVIKY